MEAFLANDDGSILMADSAEQSKVAIRSQMRATLKALSPEQRHAASVAACARLIKLEAFEHAAVIMLYMPLANEIDVTHAAMRCFRLGKTVCVPKVDWDRCEMTAVEITSLDDRVLDCDEHGLRSPRLCSPVVPSVIDLVIVPALAYDPQGNRLGRGGGYYDRFLSKVRSNVTTVGLVFDQQIVDHVPVQPHDISVDIVVTDRRLTCAKAARSGKC
jgi:5-formyltetrahydrofolate cyclo-ligase